MILTRSLTSLLSVKKGFPSLSWCWTKAWISRLKLSVEGHSVDWVANSHFSKRRASKGNRGCLELNSGNRKHYILYVLFETSSDLLVYQSFIWFKLCCFVWTEELLWICTNNLVTGRDCGTRGATTTDRRATASATYATPSTCPRRSRGWAGAIILRVVEVRFYPRDGPRWADTRSSAIHAAGGAICWAGVYRIWA